MSRTRIGLAIGLFVVLLTLVVQNTEIVTVKLLVWEVQMSRVVLILLAAATGFLAGWLVARIRGTRL